MTTYSYNLVLNDSEAIVLEVALEMMIKECQAELANGPKAPFWAWQRSAKDLLSRLSHCAELKSYSTFPKDAAE